MQAEPTASFAPRTDGDIDRIADRLSWRHDGGYPEDYPGSGWSDADWNPSPEDEAEYSGYAIGFDGVQYAAPPSDLAPAEREAFTRGHAAGFKQYEHDELDRWQERHELMEAAFGSEEY